LCNQRHGAQQSKAILFQPLTALIQVPSCRSTSTLRRVLLNGSKLRLHCHRDRMSSLWDLAAEFTKESLLAGGVDGVPRRPAPMVEQWPMAHRTILKPVFKRGSREIKGLDFPPPMAIIPKALYVSPDGTLRQNAM